MRAVHQVEDGMKAPSSTADIETSLCQSQLRVLSVNRSLQMHDSAASISHLSDDANLIIISPQHSSGPSCAHLSCELQFVCSDRPASQISS